MSLTDESGARISGAGKIALWIVAAFACAMTLTYLIGALGNSSDLQWSPAVVFWQGDDPYALFVSGAYEGRLIESQYPNYLHALYILFYPLTLLDWWTAKLVWALVNVVLTVAVTLMLCRWAGLTRSLTLACIVGVALSQPALTHLLRGQLALLMLLVLILSFRAAAAGRAWSPLLQGLAYLKPSFAPPFFIHLILTQGPRAALLSLCPAAAGWLAFLAVTGADPIASVANLLLVMKHTVRIGHGDVMSAIQSLTGVIWLGDAGFAALMALTLLLCLPTVRWIARFRPHSLLALALLSATSLVLFKHLVYEWIFLVPALVVAVKHRERREAQAILAIILVVWQGNTSVFNLWELFDPSVGVLDVGEWLAPVNFLLGLALLPLLARLAHAGEAPRLIPPPPGG